MKLHIYSIFDSVAQVFNKPWTEINDGTACRAFSNSVANDINRKDFVLYKLGSLTDHDGAIEPLSVPLKLMSGFDVDVLQELPASASANAI